MQSLEGKVAWITGAGTGIGRAAALALADAGARLVLSGRRREPLEEAAAALRQAGGEAVVEPLDVADVEGVGGVAARIRERDGRLDILVNNAGLNVGKRRWAELTPEAWRTVIDVDLNGPFYCVAAALPLMRAQRDGLIINVSSWAGRYDSYVSGPAYNAAKHALLSMNATLNMEEGRHGIRACAICPAEVATPILDRRPVPVSIEERARMLQPEDLGATIRFVACMPKHACVNEILISPTWNRAYLGSADHHPPPPSDG